MSRPQAGRALERSSGEALWQQLRDDLVRRLERGEFEERFPGEMELVEEYAVSRHTVREALRRLRQDGMISSSRGRSSVARPQQIRQQLGAIYSLFHELESRGIDQHSRVLRQERRRVPEVAARLSLPADVELVYVERIRLADDEPLAWDRTWLEPELGAPLLGVDLTHGALYDAWISVAGVRLTDGHETIRAVVPTPEQRSSLEMGDDEAALVIERTGALDGRPVEFRETMVRGSRFSFTAQWASGRAYQVDVRS